MAQVAPSQSEYSSMVMLNPDTLAIAFVDAGMFCVMAWWDAPFDSVAFIGLAMAVGLSVDYVCHVAHALEHADAPSPSERTVAALTAIGPSIVKAGLSTFLGVCSLAFAPARYFRTFFALLFSMVAFGLVAALALFPAAASLLPTARRRGAAAAAKGADGGGLLHVKPTT